jgi:hypothetical protein
MLEALAGVSVERWRKELAQEAKVEASSKLLGPPTTARRGPTLVIITIFPTQL